MKDNKTHKKDLKHKIALLITRILDLFIVSNSAVITIWSDDINEAKHILEKVYLQHGWDIKEPIKTKWSWSKFDFMYVVKLIKK